MPRKGFSTRVTICFEEHEGEKWFVAANNNTPGGIAEALGVPVEKLLALNQGFYPGLKVTSQFKAGTLMRVPPGVKKALPAGSKATMPQSDKKEQNAGGAGAALPGEKRGREGAGEMERSKRAKVDGGASPGTPSAGGKRRSDCFYSPPPMAWAERSSGRKGGVGGVAWGEEDAGHTPSQRTRMTGGLEEAEEEEKGSDDELTAYERERRANISRNQQFLIALGIDQHLAPKPIPKVSSYVSRSYEEARAHEAAKWAMGKGWDVPPRSLSRRGEGLASTSHALDTALSASEELVLRDSMKGRHAAPSTVDGSLKVLTILGGVVPTNAAQTAAAAERASKAKDAANTAAAKKDAAKTAAAGERATQTAGERATKGAAAKGAAKTAAATKDAGKKAVAAKGAFKTAAATERATKAASKTAAAKKDSAKTASDTDRPTKNAAEAAEPRQPVLKVKRFLETHPRWIGKFLKNALRLTSPDGTVFRSVVRALEYISSV